MVPVHSWTFSWCAETQRVVRLILFIKKRLPGVWALAPPSTEATGARPRIRVSCVTAATAASQQVHILAGALPQPGSARHQRRHGYTVCWASRMYYLQHGRRASVLCTSHLLIAFALGEGGGWMTGVDPCLNTLTLYFSYCFLCTASWKCTPNVLHASEST